jgi:hypothetical protein
MSCDYKIVGEVNLRRTNEVMEAIRFLQEDVLGHDHVEVEQLDDNTIKLRIDYDDINTVHTPDHIQGFLETIRDAVVGAGLFDISTSGDSWSQWVGNDNVIRQEKSAAARRAIQENAQDLLPEDVERVVETLRSRPKNNR